MRCPLPLPEYHNKNKNKNMTNLIDQIIAYETGEIDEQGVLELFQELVNTGQAWTLQGHYGRTASDLLEAGLIMLGEEGHMDYYGNYVPSRTEVEPGTKGSPEYVKNHEN